MTPERLATLCGLLPGWEFRETNGVVYFRKSPIVWFNSEIQSDADHLLMEALRAVKRNPKVAWVDIRVTNPAVQTDEQPCYAGIMLRLDGEFKSFTKPGIDPLHALLDAVREAGLVKEGHK